MSRTKLLLLTGSLFSFAILILLSAIWYLNFVDSQSNLRNIVQLQQASRYINTMHFAALERGMILNRMLVTEDVFERDEQFLEFRRRASHFLRARDHLLGMPLFSGELKATWEEVRPAVTNAGIVQNRLINLLYESRDGIRDRRIFKMVRQQIIPAQERFMNKLSGLREVQWRFVENAANKTIEANNKASKYLLGLTSAAALLLAFVSIFVFRRISRYERNLVNARNEAMVANRHKSLFLTRVSHEFRTPLNAILGFAQLTEMHNKEFLHDEDIGENTGQILQAGHHLRDLIEEILDLAKIEAGKISLEMENINVVQLVENVLDMLRHDLEARSIDVSLKGIENLQVFADRRRLKQVLLNLLSNAVKYNRNNGSITVSAMAEDGMVRIEITDTGHGIRKENMDNLFRMFNRLDSDRKGIEGSGIGLVISRSLIAAMDGEIGVESVYGKGSIFWICLNGNSCTIPDL